MEAVKFLLCHRKMCNFYRDGCDGCEAQEIECDLTTDYPEKLVEAVEQWAKAHPEEAADVTKPKKDETCGIKPEEFVNRFVAETFMRHEEQIEKLAQNVEKLMKPVNAAEEPTSKPKRTRKDVLLAAFPNAAVDSDGVPECCPKKVELENTVCRFNGCAKCCAKYWLAEVEE